MKLKYVPTLLCLFLFACASTPIKKPVQVSERIILLEGFNKGKIQYLADEMKQGKLDEVKGLVDYLNPNYKDKNLNIYAGQINKRLYFDNSIGGEVYLMKILHDGKVVQECDEPEYLEKRGNTGVNMISAGPGPNPVFVSSGPAEDKIQKVHDIRCILKHKPDTIFVELYDPYGMHSKYQVLLN